MPCLYACCCDAFNNFLPLKPVFTSSLGVQPSEFVFIMKWSYYTSNEPAANLLNLIPLSLCIQNVDAFHLSYIEIYFKQCISLCSLLKLKTLCIPNNLFNSALGRARKASSVGAKTVKVPSLFSVSVSPADWIAVTNKLQKQE